MKKLLEENETLTQIVFDRRPTRTDSPIYKPKFSSKNPTKKASTSVVDCLYPL